ncbi:MAG: NTP transferase domain-containing protein [Rhodospirillales bacterium]|nr:NTP transferase domain-containing protein [Rhodospirillales bacterium]
MKILLPLAGRDKFFRRDGCDLPKPLVKVGGVPLIKRVVDWLHVLDSDGEFVFVVHDEDCRKFDLDGIVGRTFQRRATFVRLSGEPQGTACCALMAIEHIDNDDELIIFTGDQLLDVDLADLVETFRRRRLDAGVAVFRATHPRWSYVRADEHGNVVEAAHDRAISRLAIAGFYYFARGRDFVAAAMRSIANAATVGGEHCVAPTLNEFVQDGRAVGLERIPNERCVSLRSPRKVAEYERRMDQSRGGIRRVRRTGRPPVNVVIPMAGEGKRFADAGFAAPKPFIDIDGRMMIEHVLDNLAIPEARYILLAREEHLRRFPAAERRLRQRADVEILPVEGLTEGTACTVLLARPFIDNDARLLIANCDQIVDFDCGAFVEDCGRRGWNGSILVFRDAARDPKWSFAKLDDAGMVAEVREKVPISDLATVGIYLFSRGADFVDAAIDMIARNDRVNGEFYTCPVYNYAIRRGAAIGIYEVASEQMHGVGTPEDLRAYCGAMGFA